MCDLLCLGSFKEIAFLFVVNDVAIGDLNWLGNSLEIRVFL